MADLSEFRSELRGLSNIEREALQDMLLRLRDNHAGTDRFGSAFAAAMNVLLWSVKDARTEAEETRRLFDRMLTEGGVPQDYLEPLSIFDR